MLKKILVIITLLFFNTFLFATNFTFEQIVVFGDSLSEVGNTWYNKSYPQPPAYYTYKRFTNGKVWVEYLVDAMGYPELVPSELGGTNYAYGGAETGCCYNQEGKPNIGEQIERYLSQVGSSKEIFAKNTKKLVILWGGGNDIKNLNFDDTLDNIINHINRLARAGHKHFLIPNIPSLATLPALSYELPQMVKKTLTMFQEELLFFNEEDVFYNDLIDLFPPDELSWQEIFYNTFIKQLFTDLGQEVPKEFNTVLKEKLKKLAKLLNIKIYYFDVYTLCLEVFLEADKYGIDFIEGRALFKDKGEGVYFYYDAIHPSTIVHKILAQKAYNLL